LPDGMSLGELLAELAELRRLTAAQAERIGELERRLAADSQNSSRPPSSDPLWQKRPAKKRSGRAKSGRKPGKQPGAASSSRALVDDADRVVVIEPEQCSGCDGSLAEGVERSRERRQVVDARAVPPPEVVEYQLVSKLCSCCGAVNTPGWDTGDQCGEVVAGPGSAVRIGPETLARCALLTCGHFLPVGRATALLEALTGMRVSTGFTARVRRRAARKLTERFLPHLRTLLASAPVLHADETTGRAAGALAYVHVACTEYLTLMHVGGRSAADIDAGQVLPAFTGVLVRDGYAGYQHLPAVHAWCGAHLLRDLRAVSDADPAGQVWALAMADTLIEAHHAAREARECGADRLDEPVLARIRNHYRGAVAKGRSDNQGKRGALAVEARTLTGRFHRFEDMILRFATDLAVPFTNYAEGLVMPMVA
jgi:transposase